MNSVRENKLIQNNINYKGWSGPHNLFTEYELESIYLQIIKTYPISMLWCSHIKKRAKCSDEEKRDYNVVLPMCRFGCDELFEKGFIGVDDDGLIIQTKSISNKNIQNYINDLVGNKCDGFSNKNLKYFKWHREFHK